MSTSETQRLLQTFRIVPNKLSGQNFLADSSFFPKLSGYASLSKTDVVLDAGAGFGLLTRFLSNKCKCVVAVEKDPRIATVLREQLKGVANVTVIEGDVLKVVIPGFSKVVSVPPYYLSSRLVMWLFNRRFEIAVLILQREFADRLVATVSNDAYGWLTVVAFHSAQVELLNPVPKEMFFPQPEVDSVIVRLTPWTTVPFEVKDEAFFRRMVRWLFTQRNKKLSNAIVPFINSTFKVHKEDAGKLVSALSFRETRVRDLPPEAFGELANVLLC